MQKIKYSPIFLFSIFLFFFACKLATGQTNPDPYGKVTIASPTAGSLGKYGDIPVSYHTGIPNIDIPLYTVTNGSLKLPISLSYHASGLKVQETASWVGAGWSLNAGGVITRTVVGGPDEYNTNSAQTELKGHFSDYGYNNYMQFNGQQQAWVDFANGRLDGEPDLFFFNFNGYVGKFYFRDDRTPILVPEADFKIVPIYVEHSGQSIQGFIITTPDGVKYSFGRTPGFTGADPVETTIPVNSQTGASTATVISSWYLNKISTADGIFNITLNYAAESYGYFTWNPKDLKQVYNYTDVPSSIASNIEYDLVKNIIHGVRLSSIIYPTGNINFNPSSSPRSDLSDDVKTLFDNNNNNSFSLGNLIIKTSNLCKKFNFSYSYFYDPSPATGNFASSAFGYNLHTDQKRLRLDTIREISCDNKIKVNPYTFKYFTEKVYRRLSFEVDHWGFMNGKQNSTLIPTYSINNGNEIKEFQGANRESSWPDCRGGSLQSITYPTGGSNIFNFESTILPIQSSPYRLVPISSGIINNLTFKTTFTFEIKSDQRGPVEISFKNNSTAWSPVLTIKDPSGKPILGTPFRVDYSTPVNQSLNLAPGIYTIYAYYESNSVVATPSYLNLSECYINQYQYVPTTNYVTVGGLRIKSIVTDDGTGKNNRTRNYSYGQSSSSILYSYPIYIGMARNDIIKELGFWNPATGFTQSIITFNGCTSLLASYYRSCSSLRPMETTQGYHIGYTNVTVSEKGNGSTVYNYYGNTYGMNSIPKPPNGDIAFRYLDISSCDNNQPNYPAAPLPHDFMRGELQSEQHYSESGALLKDITYTPVYTKNPTGTPGFLTKQLDVFLGTFYELFTARKTKLTTVETEYRNSGNISTKKISFYGSPYHHELNQMIQVDSKGDSLKTLRTYAQDFRIPSCDAIQDGIIQYKADIQANYTSYLSKISTCTNSDPSCTTKYYLAYLVSDNQARARYTSYQVKNFTGLTSTFLPNNTFQTSHNTAKSNANSELKPILTLQDEYYNPVIEESHFRNGNLLNATFTQFDYSLDPAAFVYPQKTLKLYLKIPSKTFQKTIVTGNSIFKDPRYIDDEIYSFKKGVLENVKRANGSLTSYIWGYANTLPVGKIENANSNKVAYTSFENGESNNWLIPSAGIQNYQNIAKTGNWRYNFSISSTPIVSSNTLLPAGNYIVSYWASNSLNVNGRTTTSKTSVKNPIFWGYYEHLVKLTSPGSIKLTGTGQLDELRLYPQGATMTTYSYNPGVGMTSMTNKNNITNYYEYDALGRLMNMKDVNRKVDKNYAYRYANYIYKSSPLGKSFTRNNCTTDQIPTSVTFKVDSGAFSSIISLNDANQKASNYLNDNGPTYANNNGTCINVYKNVSTSGTFTKSDCFGANVQGTAVTYTVPAGTYTSTISLADANQKAQADVNSYGQTNANLHGNCYCTAGCNSQYISGRCEYSQNFTVVSCQDTGNNFGGGRYVRTLEYRFSDGSTGYCTEFTNNPCP